MFAFDLLRDKPEAQSEPFSHSNLVLKTSEGGKDVPWGPKFPSPVPLHLTLSDTCLPHHTFAPAHNTNKVGQNPPIYIDVCSKKKKRGCFESIVPGTNWKK